MKTAERCGDSSDRKLRLRLCAKLMDAEALNVVPLFLFFSTRRNKMV